MFCCVRDKELIDRTLYKNVEFVTKTVPASKLKEMKAFNSVCRGYRLGKEDEYIPRLCNERIKIYVYNDNTSERTRQCLMLCDAVIKTIEFNKKVLKMDKTDSDDEC